MIEESGFDFRQGKEMFLFSVASRLGMGLDEYRKFFLEGYIGQDDKLTSHVHLMPILRMRGSTDVLKDSQIQGREPRYPITVKAKAFPVHAVKAHRRSRGIAPLILNSGIAPLILNRGIAPLILNRGIAPLILNRGIAPLILNRGIPPLILNLSTEWWWVVNFTPRPVWPGKEPRYPLNRRPGGPQNRSRRFGKKSLAPIGIWTLDFAYRWFLYAQYKQSNVMA